MMLGHKVTQFLLFSLPHMCLDPQQCNRYSDHSTGWKTRGWTHGRGKRCLSSPNTPDWLQGPPSLLFNGYQCCSPMVNRAGRLVDHSSQFRVEVKNKWSYTFIPTIRLCGMDRGIFSFYACIIMLFMLRNELPLFLVILSQNPRLTS